MKKFLKRVLKAFLMVVLFFVFAIGACVASYYLQQYGFDKRVADTISIFAFSFVALIFVVE